jgi:4-amino-4-deoxy-L-arabinose transferase-like glycosyltransferase
LTIGFQVFAMIQYGELSWWMLGLGILFIAGSLLMVMAKRVAYVTILASMLIVPIYWSVMTVSSSANQNLPTAYNGSNQLTGPDRARQQGDGGGSNVNTELVAYLEENTQNMEYLVAVPSSQQGSILVLATGRPVLYMGGFGGQDEVVNADDLAKMVANGELKYIMYGNIRGGNEEIVSWLNDSCLMVTEFSQTSGQTNNGPQMPGDQQISLYQCR